jgi:orotidine-5'-phosphate decarboxylase
MNASNPIFVALDTVSLSDALKLARAVGPYVGGVKVGLEFFCANGPSGVKEVIASGVPVFLDLKLHDIQNTVSGAVRALSPLTPAIVNVHASGGVAMMKAAAAALSAFSPRPKLIAVTVLTSLDEGDLAAMGIAARPIEQVERLARLVKQAGLDGVVCSPQEIGAVRAACGKDFLIVTPGVRPAGAELNDQRRVMTPVEAIKAGADLLVIGRPITGAPDPAAAARAIAAELGV